MASCGRRPEASRVAITPRAIAISDAIAEPAQPPRVEPMIEPEDEPGEAMRFFVAQRAPDGVNLPIERLAAAKEHAKRMRSTSIAGGRPGAGRATSTSSNSNAGGVPAPGSWTNVGPANVGGLTRAFVIHPQNPDIMYAGASGGGVWKSTDAGKTWTPATDFLITDSIQSLAMDPRDPNTIYAGTGDNIGGAVGIRGRGIFKTTDGGQSWSLLSGTDGDANFYYNYALVVSPNDSNRIYAGTSTGIWISTDGGNNWTRSLARVAPNTGCEELLLRTDQSTDYLFAACGRNSAAQTSVFRNVDASGGAPWESVLALPGMGRTSLAIAPSKPNIIYALVTDADPTSDFYQGALGVFRSDSNGDSGTWQAKTTQGDTNRVNLSLLSNPQSTFADTCRGGKPSYNGQGQHDNVLAVDPTNPDRVWAGGVDTFRSDDGGSNWGIAMFWEASAPIGAHADNHRLVFHPNYDGDKNQTLYNTSDGGIYMTANATAEVATGVRAGCSPYPTKVAWKSLNAGYSVTQFYDGAVYPGANQYIAGAQDNGTLWGADGFGKSWVVFRGGDGGFVLVNPKDPNEVYSNYVYLSLDRSTDGGNTLQSIIKGITEPNSSSNFLFIVPVAMDPNEPRRIYLGGRALWRSSDRGDNWDQGSALSTSLQGRISAIAVSPLDSNTVLYATEGGYVFRSQNALSTDGNAIWDVSRPRTSGYVARIAFDPVDVNTAYVVYRTYKGTGQNYVYKTSDGGANWTPIDGSGSGALPDAPVHSIVVDPLNNQTLYAGTEMGVFTSVDGGNSWLRDDNNFANTPVTQLVLDRSAGVTNLIAFTFGRGVWKTAVPGSGTPCAYALSTTTPSVPANSAAINVAVDTGSGCTWSVTPVSVTVFAKSPAIGTGPGAAGIYGSWNASSAPRTGVMIIADKQVTVTQKAATGVGANDDTAALADATGYLGYTDSRKYTIAPTDPVHSCTNSQDYKSAWWSFVAPSTGTAEIAAQGRRYDVAGNSGVVLTVYDTDRASANELACSIYPRNTGAWAATTVLVPVTKGKVYQVEISATGDTANDGGQTILSVLMK